MRDKYSSLVPVCVDMAARRVEMCELRGATFREPFLSESIQRFRNDQPTAANAEISVEDFLMLAERHRALPHGFIFHVGRCGSTLLANMLTASGTHLLIKEPETVSGVMAHWLNSEERAERLEAERLLSAMVRCLTGVTGNARYKVFKLAAWNVRMADVLMDMFPRTSSVFVYRPPTDTVASMLHQPPAWFDLIRCPRVLQMRFFPTLVEVPASMRISPELLFAHAWKSAAEAALAIPAERITLIEYHEMTACPEDALQRVLSCFEHCVTPGQISAMAAAGRTYSKDPAGTAIFDPEKAHWRSPLGPAQQAQVRAAVGDTWSRLEARRISGNKGREAYSAGVCAKRRPD